MPSLSDTAIRLLSKGVTLAVKDDTKEPAMASTEVATARELSPEERQERIDLAHSIEERIKEAIAEGKAALWRLSEALYQFEQEQGWLALGYESQTDWLGQPDIGIQRRTYFRAVRRWRELVVQRKVDTERLLALDASKVDLVLPLIEDGKVRIKTALNDAEALSASDLRQKYVKPSKPKPEPPADDWEPEDGADEPEDTDEELPVIEGTVSDEPQENGAHGPSGLEAQVQSEELAYAAGLIESWLEVGGDRRKAQRSWQRLFDNHPVFHAFTVVGACVQGGEGAPDRSEALEHWRVIRDALVLQVEGAE